jgi:hypothetical protein
MKLSLSLLALSASITTLALPQATTTSSNPTNFTNYHLLADYPGATFFDHFTAFTDPDPTHCHVQYQSLRAAAADALIGHISHPPTNLTTAYIGVDHTHPAPHGRPSVRLTSQQTFHPHSLIALDIRHAPDAHGAWPALWLLGDAAPWPASGESDIFESVHRDTRAAATLHTGPGCVVANASRADQLGRLTDTDCNAGNAALGCSVRAPTTTNSSSDDSSAPGSAAATLNTQGGAVYVHDWRPDSITIWSFPRNQPLPADLSSSLSFSSTDSASSSSSPNPSLWLAAGYIPLAHFSGPGCDFGRAFRDMRLVINIAFCGEWAGGVWESSGAAAETGVRTCEEFVTGRPEEFREAFWEIAGVRAWGVVEGGG